MARGQDGLEPTILIKANDLLLKALARGVDWKLHMKFLPEDRTLIYGIEIYDDLEFPVVIWSCVENSEEIGALKKIGGAIPSPVFLFNELAINVLEALPTSFEKESQNREISFNDVVLHPRLTLDRQRALERDFPDDLSEKAVFWDVTLKPSSQFEWRRNTNIYITNAAQRSEIDLLDLDEGAQQERLALWLSDGLSIEGVAINPEIIDGGKRRELCDVFFGYENGTFFIESKCVSVFNKRDYPSNKEIRESLRKHVKKALRQLAGARKKVKDGSDVFFGEKILSGFDRNKTPHCIVLVSDLDHLNEAQIVNIAVVAEFMLKNNAMLHFLDLTELMRLVQGAHMFMEQGEQSLMFYFDYLLLRRWEKTIESEEAVMNLLIHKEEPN